MLLATLMMGVHARDTVSFDFGWLHRTGLHDWASPDDPPPLQPDPGLSPAESHPAYNDSNWGTVQLPHDALIGPAPTMSGCPDGCSGRSYIGRHVLWYRKAFTLPTMWKGSMIYVDFEGSFRETTVWVNGEKVAFHDCGYTPFRIRLDNLTSLKYGKEANLLAVFVDPDNGDEGGRDHGSGWWYEGGGLYRSASLVRTDTLHIEQDGLFAYSNLSNGVAQLHARTAIMNGGSTAVNACVILSLSAPDGTEPVAPMSSEVTTLAGGETTTLSFTLTLHSPQLWSSANPNVYSVSAQVYRGACGAGSTSDTASVSHGFRSLRYDANEGFFLNEEHFKVRGFCDHNTFAVVGMAVPDRINLFRAQASRAIGGNGRRTSHNPPASSMLRIYDRVGIVVMDENRLFANVSKYVANMAALVKRDRNHPSVVIWSFCNEVGCEGTREAGGPRFQQIAYEYDGSRPTLGNMFTFNDLLSHTIDVQGFSHQSRAKLTACHAKLPDKPIYMSECCSCNTFRDQDEGCETTHDNPHTKCDQISFNARCAEQLTNASDGVAWTAGTMIWTLFDYYGEPPVGGYQVSSSYGQYDLAGLPKASAFWYRAQWLLAISDARPDKTFKTGGGHEVHLVESWEAPTSLASANLTNLTKTMHAYSSAPSIELLVNGRSIGSKAVTRMVDGPGAYAEWVAVPWEAGTVTAVARDTEGKAVAQTERRTNGEATALVLSIDAPSATTGTGSALLLDGQDAALLRASVVDDHGDVVHSASHNVSFRVVSGPGRVQGCHNGDTRSHLRNDLSWYPAYHGLVRAIVRVTSVAGREQWERNLLSQIDQHGPMALRTSGAPQGGEETAIVVEASTPGLKPVQVAIVTSTDAKKDGVMEIAASMAGKPVDFFGKGA